MKYILFLLMAVSVLNSSCRKESFQENKTTVLFSKITQYLQDSLEHEDFNQLNFSKINFCKYNDHMQTVMVPFRYDSVKSRHFIVLQIQAGERIDVGKIINLSVYNFSNNSSTKQKKFLPNGKVSISSLNRVEVSVSGVTNGYIGELNTNASQNITMSPELMTNPYQDLPEVIVVAYSSSGSGNYAVWFNVLSMMGMPGEYNNFYQTLEYYPDGGGGGGGGGGEYNPTIPMQVDFESDYSKDAIDIEKYLRCFDAIPDAGSLTSITMLTDIPVDNDPTVFFDWSTGSPGHTFIRLNKSNGGQHVQQVIGFYPQNGWKTALIPDPIDAKFVDNGQHEFNASIRMTVSPQDFKSMLNRLKYLAVTAKYDIDEFNCTDLALDIFNQSRGANPLIIPSANIPGGGAGIESNTPQGLYQKLHTMKLTGGAEAANINMPGVKASEGISDGPCN